MCKKYENTLYVPKKFHYTYWRMGTVGNRTGPQRQPGSGSKIYFFSLYELNEVKVNLRGGLENKEQKEV